MNLYIFERFNGEQKEFANVVSDSERKAKAYLDSMESYGWTCSQVIHEVSIIY